MRLDSSELSRAVKAALSLSAVAAVGVAGTAFAQQATTTQTNTKQPQTLQTVVVTGSHIRSVDLATDNPVIAVTSQQIQATGKLTLGGVIDQLPAITGNIQTPATNNGGGSGGTFVGLRGLGSGRTLFLIDGQRVGDNDLSAIPTAAVQRIEILTSGASAIYGSDAIGGVINVILKSNYQGAQFTANYGISDHNDGERKGGSFSFGQSSDKGNIFAVVSENKFDGILQAARPFSANALSLSNTPNGRPTAVIGGSTFAGRDWIGVSPALSQKFGCADGGALSLNQSTFDSGAAPTASDFHCYGKSDGYNYAAINYLMTPNERTNAVVKGTYHLSNNVDFFATWLHNSTTSESQLAPSVFGTPTVGGLTISKDSMYNPFGVNFSSTSGAGYRARMIPAGPRASDNNSVNDQLLMGFKGDFNIGSFNWNWDAGYNYNHSTSNSLVMGLPQQNLILPGLGPSMMVGGVPTCVHSITGGTGKGNIISGCTPWDPFNLNSASAKQVIGAAAATALEAGWGIERQYYADVTGGIFNLPAGTAQLALGASYRKEYSNNAIDPLLVLNSATGTCTLGSECSAHLQGGFNVKEVYAELAMPLLKDLPFVKSLDIDLGDRYSKYSDFGSTSNWKIGVSYRPINDLLLRADVTKVFRAPSIGDVFGAPVSSAPLLSSDPCDGITVANPACVGVPLTGKFVDQQVKNSQQIQGLSSGSQYAGFPLGPEKGKTFDFGAVYSPHYVPGLTLTADIWRIYLNDEITGVSAQQVLTMCFNGQSAFCPLISRVQNGPNAGQIAHLVEPTANLGRFDVKGVDFSAQYRLPAFSFGQFNVGVQGTYMKQWKQQTAPGLAGNLVLNGAGVLGGNGSELGTFIPRIQALGNAGWQLGPWSAQWTMRYIKGWTMENQTGFDVPGVDFYGSWIQNNLMVGYDIQPINTQVSFGVDNVFDKQPPMLFANRALNSNTQVGNFDTIGRYYWGRITVSF